MYHYCYKLELKETGEYYFGSRTSKVIPECDKYMGSMRTWKPEKCKLIKTILRNDFTSREDCILYERELIITFKDDILNKNVNIPGGGFNTLGLGQYVNSKGKVYRVNKNDQLVLNGLLKPFWSGRIHSDDSKKKMSDSATGRKMSEESKKKMSDYHTDRPKSKETKKRMRASALGDNNNYKRFLKRTGSPHAKSKIVIQYDLEGNQIKEWENTRKASNKLGVSNSGLNNCVLGKTKTSCGFIWKYKNIIDQ